jgi:hypothetical protein
LILNAETHLDSDLAVDGLTLLEALDGHWRWHYPGTPAIGTLPVLLSLPQAALWGATPITLVSGGAVAYGLLTIAVFALAWRGFGAGAAGWSLVPLAFASTGTLWLSGRITGGHLLTAAWHAGAFALLHEALVRGRRAWTAALGLWCGLGLVLDAMFLVTLIGLAAAALLAWRQAGWPRRGLGAALVCAVGFLAGAWPREVGRRLEPHDAYHEQFQVIGDPEVLKGHAGLLGTECLPRLIVGHRLPGLQADPDPRALAGPGPSSAAPDRSLSARCVSLVGLVLSAAALFALALAPSAPPGTAVRSGLLVSAAVVLAGFVLNRNIFNSDNYRYLVTLLVPWAIGFGLLMRGLARRGKRGLLAARLCAIVLAGLMTIDTLRWYARLGWIDASGRPVRLRPDDPALAWLFAHPTVTLIYGDYWDVYRLAFLTGGGVRGVPLPYFPDRFPEWSQHLPGGRPDVLIVRPTAVGLASARDALQAGGRVLLKTRRVLIVTRPKY